MADIVKDLILDVSKYNEFVKVLLQQGESITRKLKITITEDFEEYQIPDGAIVRIIVDKTDGTFVDNVCNVIENKVIVEITPAMTQIAKRIPANIVVTDPNTGGTLITKMFHFLVQETTLNESMQVSVSEFTTLTNMLLSFSDITNYEAIRVNNENTRITGENTRIINENERQQRETNRVNAETNRANTESSRVSAESTRVTSESNRVSAENTRQSQETSRQSNEATRIANENLRQSTVEAIEMSYAPRLTEAEVRLDEITYTGIQFDILPSPVNCTTALNNAIDYISSNGGGTLDLSNKTYLVSGITLKDNVIIQGKGKNTTTLFLMDGSNNHVIQAGDFDINADGVFKSTPVGCRTSGLKRLSVDGNKSHQTVAKHGLAYYGIDLQLDEVEFKNAKGINLYTESPGQTYSSVVGQNLQYSIRHIECHDGDGGNFYYNGQSDSTLIDIMCYQTGIGAGQFNFKSGTKALGLRVLGMHCWGDSDYGLINEASTAGFTHCHVESATIAKVWIKAATYFDGRVYQAGSVGVPNSAPAFLIENGISNNNIRTTISNCDIGVKFVGTDGGNGLYDIQMYNGINAAVLFNGIISATNMIRARLTGITTSNIFQMPNLKMVQGSNTDFSTANNNYSFWTDEAKTLRQFAIEHTALAESYVAATGGTTLAGPSLLVRGTNADYDLKLIPKGAGKVRFGAHVTNADTTITGYIEIKDSGGTIRKLAVIS